jgi:hypothetical protein
VTAGRWNEFIALGPAEWARLREQLITLLREDVGSNTAAALSDGLIPMATAQLRFEFSVTDYNVF